MGGPTPAFNERVHVTLSRRGDLFLNARAHARMGKPLAVYLYYNRVTDTIILEPTDVLSANNAFLLRQDPTKKTNARFIRANPFGKHFNILPESTIRFLTPEVDAVGRMYLKLYETVIIASPNKGKGKKKVGL